VLLFGVALVSGPLVLPRRRAGEYQGSGVSERIAAARHYTRCVHCAGTPAHYYVVAYYAGLLRASPLKCYQRGLVPSYVCCSRPVSLGGGAFG
jgi:hypothetical protein